MVADGTPEEFVAALSPTMFFSAVPSDTAKRFDAEHARLPPARVPGMARASAEDVRDVLPGIDVATLLVYGDGDVRAPLAIAEALQASIPGRGSSCCPGSDHVCNVEAPDEFNAAVRAFLDERG